MARVHEKLGSWVLSRALEDIELESTSWHDLYEDETQNGQTFSQLAEQFNSHEKW